MISQLIPAISKMQLPGDILRILRISSPVPSASSSPRWSDSREAKIPESGPSRSGPDINIGNLNLRCRNGAPGGSVLMIEWIRESMYSWQESVQGAGSCWSSGSGSDPGKLAARPFIKFQFVYGFFSWPHICGHLTGSCQFSVSFPPGGRCRTTWISVAKYEDASGAPDIQTSGIALMTSIDIFITPTRPALKKKEIAALNN